MTNSEESSRHEQQAAIHERIEQRVSNVLNEFGRPDTAIEHGDYSVQCDYLDYPEVVVFVGNLAILQPNIVGKLREVIKGFPGWQITMTVAVRGHYRDWPNMGLYIRPHEIIDALQRQYFPAEYQKFEYPGARRGTAYD